METVVKRTLRTETLIPFGRGGGGCVNEGRSYSTDDGTKLYVKYNTNKSGARRMFDGEFASLNAIAKTNEIRVPKPIAVDDYQTGSFLIMEHLEMKSLASQTAAQLGVKLANLHLHNAKRLRDTSTNSFVGREGGTFVERFGFETTTCCGFLPLNNEWKDDWVHFYCGQRIEPQMNLDEVKGDREAREWWNKILRKIPSLFEGIDVVPALLHGDLWSGNMAQTEIVEASGGSSSSGTAIPAIFDPASFYGHHEFEFGIITMFGGFNQRFFDAYHSVIPKSRGFEKRLKLYELFHHLNHWNHFGSGYRGSTISIMKKLAS